MQNGLIKKIVVIFIVPISLLIFGWATWVTQQAFSAQQTGVTLQEHKIISNNEFTDLNKSVDDLHNKMDKNQISNTEILLDIQKQIGDLK